MANKFVDVDDASVVLREKGVYRQVSVYALGERLFAEHKKLSFIALLAGDGTSAPNVTWSELDVPFKTGNVAGRIVKKD